jgi:hypothetical protein
MPEDAPPNGDAPSPRPVRVSAWGGRKARCRGSARNLTDLITRAGVLNLANLARKGLHIGPTGWATA